MLARRNTRALILPPKSPQKSLTANDGLGGGSTDTIIRCLCPASLSLVTTKRVCLFSSYVHRSPSFRPCTMTFRACVNCEGTNISVSRDLSGVCNLLGGLVTLFSEGVPAPVLRPSHSNVNVPSFISYSKESGIPAVLAG